MEYLESLDYSLFSALNGTHAEYFDHLMWLIAAKLAWVPMILILLWLTAKRGGWKLILIVIFSIALTILISDQVASSLIKPLVGRLRPSHDPALSSTIHLVNNYQGGMYGFVSSHASNSVGCATLIMLLFRNRLTTLVMTVWAFLVCYCRIYEGVHFPGDIICGAIVGIIAALIVYQISKFVLRKYCDKSEFFTNQDGRLFSAAVVANLLLIFVLAIFHQF